jgi:hypothetical protein
MFVASKASKWMVKRSVYCIMVYCGFAREYSIWVAFDSKKDMGGNNERRCYVCRIYDAIMFSIRQQRYLFCLSYSYAGYIVMTSQLLMFCCLVSNDAKKL